MMKHTSVLSLAAATALFCGAAQAADDVTSPLYLTSELEALSTTSLAYNRTHIKHDSAKEDFILKETALVGIAPETSVLAAIGNRFNTKHLTNNDYNNDINLDYELGIKKNFRSADGVIIQTGASYYTYNPRSWFGRSPEAKEKIRAEHGNTRWYKELRGEIKAGYEIEDGLMPYGAFGMRGNIDDSDRELYYSALIGVHKLEYDWSFDAGLRYDFDFSDNDNQDLYVQGAADYCLTDTMTFGAYADYRLVGSNNPKVSYAYTTEVRFRILF